MKLLSSLLCLMTLGDVNAIHHKHQVKAGSCADTEQATPGCGPVGGFLAPLGGFVCNDTGMYQFKCYEDTEEETKVQTCTTNLILQESKCVCPAGLVSNPSKRRNGEPIKVTHYIFAFDSTDSMITGSNNLWSELMGSFSLFLNQATLSSEAIANSKVSVLTYNYFTTRQWFKQSPDMDIAQGTEFQSNPQRVSSEDADVPQLLREISSIIDQSSGEFEEYKVIMFTDQDLDSNDALSIQDQVNRIRNKPWAKKMKFEGVYRGGSFSGFQQMANSFPFGTSTRVRSSTDQNRFFARLFPIQYTDCICPSRNEVLVNDITCI